MVDEVRKMLSIEEVLAVVPVSRSTLFKMENEGRFPRGSLIANRKIWFADEIAAWQETLPPSRVGRRRKGPRRAA